MLKPGTILDQRYELLALIGEGGFGAVWKAWESQLNRIVAIKTLHALSLTDEKSRMRFRREGRALGRLSHKHLTRCFRFGLTPEQHGYIVMEFVDGTSLRQILEQEKLSTHRILAIGSQTCEALQAAHSRGIIHRDLSPNNIMLLNNESEDFVKVIDFGLSRVVNNDDSTLNQRLTATGKAVGSPHYLSPERWQGEEGDARSDVYALGCILYEMLTGRPVFEGENLLALMRKHLEDQPEALSKVISKEQSIPEGLQNILNRALAKEPGHRYQTMNEFDSDLTLVAEGKGQFVASPTRVDMQSPARNSPTRTHLILLLATIIGLTIGGLVWSRRLVPRATTSLEESIPSKTTASRRLKTPPELESWSRSSRIEYYSNWLQTYENVSSLSAAQARYRLAVDLEKIDPVECKINAETAMAEYNKAFDLAVEAKRGFDANDCVIGMISCLYFLKRSNELATLLPQLIEQIQSKGEEGLGVPLTSCRSELAQFYINVRDYKTALTTLDLALGSTNAASISPTEFLSMSAHRSRCLRMLGRDAEAKAQMLTTLRAETNLSPSSALKQRLDVVQEAEAEHLPPSEQARLAQNAVKALRSFSKPYTPIWPLYKILTESMISLKQHAEAFDLVADGLQYTHPELANERLAMWQMMCKCDRDARLNRHEQLRELMLKEISALPANSSTTTFADFMQSILIESKLYASDKNDTAALSLLQCVRSVLSKYKGEPEATVYHPVIHASILYDELKQSDEARSLLRTANAKLETCSRAPGFQRMRHTIIEHMLAQFRVMPPIQRDRATLELLNEIDRYPITGQNMSSDDQTDTHLLRCRIYKEARRLPEARTEAIAAIRFAQKSGDPFKEGAATLELAIIAQGQHKDEEAEENYIRAGKLFPKDRWDWRFRYYSVFIGYYITQHKSSEVRKLMVYSLEETGKGAPAVYNNLRTNYLVACSKFGLPELKAELEQRFKPMPINKT